MLTRLAGSMDSIRSRAASLPFVELSLGRWTAALTHRSKWFRVLDLYVLMGFWFFFALVLAVFVSLFVLVTLFELLADIVKNDVDAEIVARYFFFLLPQVLYYVIPLTVLMAVLINLGTLTKTNEILAVKASAISLYRVAMPVVIMGLVLSVGLYGLQDFLLPVSNQLQDEYRNTIKGRASQTYRDPDRKWMVGSNDQIYHYRYFDPDQNVFGGISVFEFEPARFKLRRWVFATRAAWDDAAWVFEDGWIRTLRPDGSVNYQAFDDVAFDGMVDGPEHFKKDVRTAQQMTYLELRRYIQDLRQSGFDVNDLTVELHRKLSFPLVSFIMAVIGIPFSFMTGKRGAFYGIGMCVVTGIFYWSTFELFDKLGGVERLSPVIAAWFPNLIFGSLGLWLLLRVKT